MNKFHGHLWGSMCTITTENIYRIKIYFGFNQLIDGLQQMNFQQVTRLNKYIRSKQVLVDTTVPKLSCDGAVWCVELTSIHFCASSNAQSAGWCWWDGPASAAGLAIEQRAPLCTYQSLLESFTGGGGGGAGLFHHRELGAASISSLWDGGGLAAAHGPRCRSCLKSEGRRPPSSSPWCQQQLPVGCVKIKASLWTITYSRLLVIKKQTTKQAKGRGECGI